MRIYEVTKNITKAGIGAQLSYSVQECDATGDAICSTAG